MSIIKPHSLDEIIIDCLKNGYYIVEWLDEEGYITDREVKKLK